MGLHQCVSFYKHGAPSVCFITTTNMGLHLCIILQTWASTSMYHSIIMGLLQCVFFYKHGPPPVYHSTNMGLHKCVSFYKHSPPPVCIFLQTWASNSVSFYKHGPPPVCIILQTWASTSVSFYKHGPLTIQFKVFNKIKTDCWSIFNHFNFNGFNCSHDWITF